ncbi:MAG: NusG domain II-containing protein [Clostridia bacterium]|jgi:hypothetical protein|nr:NusG domain II-containing protein [Clostridia bacterium]
MTKKRWIVLAAFVLVAGVAIWFALSGQKTDDKTTLDILDGRELLVLMDGKELTETVVSPGAGDGLRIIVWLNDRQLADLPFGEEHTVEVLQQAGRNKIRITQDAVYMEEADCQGNDCVKMGKFTRDNWEIKVPNMIVCLPHKLSVQVTD